MKPLIAMHQPARRQRGDTTIKVLLVALIVSVLVMGTLLLRKEERSEMAQLTARTEAPPLAAPNAPLTIPDAGNVAYNSLVARAHVVNGLSGLSMAKVSLLEFYMSNGTYPRSLAELGLGDGHMVLDPKAGITGDVSLGAEGRMTLKFQGGPFKGQSIALTPTDGGMSRILWVCSSQDMPPDYLPPICRDAPLRADGDSSSTQPEVERELP